MTDDQKPDRPVRVWPAVVLALAYWTHQAYVAWSDMAMFPRFMSKSMGGLAFLLVFLILWLSNGTVRGKIRLGGLGLFLGGLAIAMFAAHRSFEPIGFMMTAVPTVLTFWTAWLVLHRVQGARFAAVTLAASLGVPFAYADFLRFEGLDGGLAASLPWRWKSTAEQAFLAAKPVKADAAPTGRSSAARVATAPRAASASRRTGPRRRRRRSGGSASGPPGRA